MRLPGYSGQFKRDLHIEPAWLGERMDYSIVVEGLLRLD